MINPEQLYKLVIELQAPYVKCYDMMGNPLCSLEESENPEETVNQLKNWMPVFTNYGRIKVLCATPTIKKGNYNKAYKYEVVLKDSAAAKVAGPQAPAPQFDLVAQMQGLMQIGAMFQQMSGNNNSASLEVEKLKMQFENERKIREIEKANEDPFKKYAGAAPIVMRMIGMKPEEIKETMMLTAMSSQYGAKASTISGPELSTDTKGPNIEEIKKLSHEDMNKRIQAALNQLPEKIGAEHLLALLELLLIKPELSIKAIELYNAGMI